MAIDIIVVLEIFFIIIVLGYLFGLFVDFLADFMNKEPIEEPQEPKQEIKVWEGSAEEKKELERLLGVLHEKLKQEEQAEKEIPTLTEEVKLIQIEEPEPNPETDHTPSYAHYVHKKCRCQGCKEANRKYHARKRKEKRGKRK